MSHYTVVVLVSPDRLPKPDQVNFEGDLSEIVRDMLAPFDENIRAAEYQRECLCGFYTADAEAYRRAEKETGLNWKDLRESYWAKPAEEREAENSWEEHTKVLREADERIEAELLKTAKPDADCDQCGGTGFYESTYNQLSKWDWWEIGGGWDGDFEKREIPTVFDNTALASELRKAEYAPFAILSPRDTEDQAHDNWSEKGKMGWFAMVADEKSDWKEIAMQIFEKYGDHYAVLVDCHI